MDRHPWRRRLRRHIIWPLLVGAALALPAAAAPRLIAPPPMDLTGGGETVRAAQGTYCWDRENPDGETTSSLCADYAIPQRPPPCKLPARAGAKIKLDLNTPARSIFVTLVVPNSEEDVLGTYSDWQRSKKSRNPKGRSVWRFRLPPEVTGAIAIDVSAGYRQGDSNTWTGLATSACRSEQAPSL